jgi:Leucine-rich repeat (LRR) protein
MRIDLKTIVRPALLFLLAAACALSLSAQTKPKPGTKPGQKKPATTAQKPKPADSKASSIPAEQMEMYRQQADQMVRFYENTLNFFWNDKVQIEDDLDEKRLVPLYKDVQAYLSDVDFFFKRARFTYQVQDVSVKTNMDQQTYFFVTTNRNLAGVTVNGDSVNSNKVRYFEINYDDSKQELKIVSIYTTKLNEKDLRKWWNGLTDEWKNLYGKDLILQEGLPLSKISNFNDTVAIVDGMAVPISDSRIYGLFLKVVDSKEIDLSANPAVSDLSPLSKLSSLVSINISNTAVSDLMPLRNLNSLEVLKCSGSQVRSLDPLKYCTHIKQLDLSGTPFADLSTLVSFPGLEVLDISKTAVSSLDPLKEMTKMQELRLTNTQVADLSPLSGMTAMTLLDFSETPVSDLTPLKEMKSLTKVWFNKTQVRTLSPLDGLTSLQSVYCDNTRIGKPDAVSYMLAHPGVVVIFATGELTKWWSTMSPDWKKVFSYYVAMDPTPTKEQLHALMTIDSINIEGRAGITALDPLIQLPRLRKLYCPNTSVNDLMSLKELMQLQYLDICNTKVATLEPLRNHQKLSTLLADNTPVKDLAPLYGLHALTLLRADNTGVMLKDGNAFIDQNRECRFVFQTYENTGWWQNLDAAWKEELLKQAGLSGDPDKFGLQAIAGLEKVSIDQNPQIATVQPVLYLSRLKELRFSDTRVISLEPLSGMTWITALGFPKNPIWDLAPIGRLTQLKELDFENSQVEDLQPIMNLTNLEVLKMSGTPIKTLKYISGMKKLTVVDLYNTRISNMDVLDQLPSLKSVKIFNTKISEKKVSAFKMGHPNCEVVYY